MNPQELRQLMTEKAEEARAIYETAKTEKRAVNADEETRYKALIAEAKQLKAEAERLEELENFQGVSKPMPENRNGQFANGRGSGEGYTATPDTAEGVFCRFVRTGDQGAQREMSAMVRDEYRASNDTTMNITTAGDGGDLVPTGHYQGIIERARPMDLTSQLGLMDIPGRGTAVDVPVDNEADDGQFVVTSESAEFDRDAPAVTKVTMTLVMYTKRVDLTYQIMQDEDSRLMNFLNTYIGQGYAATLNALMFTEALADGTAGLTLDSATAIGAAEVPELIYKLSAEYARGSSVAITMRRATEGYLRGLFGTSQFSFGSIPGPATGNGTGVQSTLWGSPLYSDGNMGQLAASGKSMMIANWSYMAKRIDPAMTFIRDPYTRSSYGEVRLNYHFRADFEVLQAAAFQYATHPTA